MARSRLLDTRTVNYLELIGNSRSYHVPPYQSDYSWRHEQWEDLWDDIVEMRDSENDRHYMGAMVVVAESDRRLVVIDGQQRLATLSIFVLAIINALHKLAEFGREPDRNATRAAALCQRFIGEQDPASLVETSRLNLNDTDNGFYQDYLVQLREPVNPKGLIHSNGLMWKCFCYFEQRIRDLDGLGDGTALARLVSETVARHLVFTLITVEDALNAYTVFETLNARGLELTTTDLLKNYIFARASTADRDAMLRRWNRIAATVGQAQVPHLLRYHMLCYLAKVRRRRLFKIVRDRYRSARDVFDLLQELEDRAEVFAAIKDPSHEFWLDIPGARAHVSELRVFRVTQMMPLVFAAWETWSRRDFERALKLICVLSFRYTVVGRLNPNDLEVQYHRASRAVANGDVATPRELFEVIKPIYPSDEQTQADFSFLSINSRGPRKKLVKHILARLESDASGKPCNAETDPGTIEHLLPENPGPEWEEAFPAGTHTQNR